MSDNSMDSLEPKDDHEICFVFVTGGYGVVRLSKW